MIKVKFTFVSLLLASSTIFASTTTQIPFGNIILNPNNTIQATYSFGVNNMIFCFTNTLQTVGNIVWNYKGNTSSSTLPIYLITNGNYQGSFADSSGIVTISNPTSTPLAVSCQFAF